MLISKWYMAFLIVAALVFGTTGTSAQDETAADRAAAVADKFNANQKFKLKYKLNKGEEIRWDVEHVATTKAQISGKHETTASRTQSTKLWKVSNVDSIGNITFVHSVESTSLWQKIGEEYPLTYDSKKDDEAPPEFAAASEMIGKPLAVVTISPNGEVIDRKSESASVSFGVGDICVPLPKESIAVGHQWFIPTVFDATDENGKRLKLKARINYELAKIVDGQAVISFKTEVLTPVESDQVRSQLLQKMNKGYVAFDIQKGRLNIKEIRWNEKVQEYAGADSFLKYNGRMTEKLVTTDKKTGERVSKASSERKKITRPGDKPIIRK